MDIETQLLATAERLFDTHGFNAVGMSRLVAESGLSSRTVYKHIGGKNALMARVLAERERRFFAGTDFSSVRALFASLARWFGDDGARGCLFFRLRAETGGAVPEIEAAVAAYHARLHARMADLVERETGVPDSSLTDQLLVLFEGATATATYRGPAVVEAAGACAAHLIDIARNPS